MRILSLCSGYGGLELAIQAAFGTQAIDAVCDNYKPARQVLRRHHPNTNIHTDVNDPSLLEYKSDIIAFGFPCQDLSRAGKQAGLNGTRSSLFYACMDVVRATQPTEVIIENVPQAEKYANIINRELWDAGYSTSWARAKAHEAGLPHRRDRVFIYAHKLGRPERTTATPPAYTPTTPTFPTPTVVDMGWGRTQQEWETWLQDQKAKHNNGNGHGRSLYQMCQEGTILVMEHLMGLPTGYITNQPISDAAKRRLLGNGVAPQQGHLGIYRAWKQHAERNAPCPPPMKQTSTSTPSTTSSSPPHGPQQDKLSTKSEKNAKSRKPAKNS